MALLVAVVGFARASMVPMLAAHGAARDIGARHISLRHPSIVPSPSSMVKRSARACILF